MSRTTPTSADLMPEVLELLKRHRELKKDAIAEYMRDWIKSHGFDEKDRSIAWALNRLAKEGYLAHPRTGTWRISEKGMASALTAQEAQEIMERWNERERSALSSEGRKKRSS